MLVYALASRDTGKAVELYAIRAEAEAALRDALDEEPAFVDVLYVEAVELNGGSDN